MKKVLLSFIAFLLFSFAKGVCPSGLSTIIVSIVPDNYPQETSWDIKDSTGTTIFSGNSVGDTVCLPSGSCHTFTIHDTYGDGIISPGGYSLYIDGTLLASGSAFGTSAQHQFNCLQGTFCSLPIPLTTYGTYTANFDDTWYRFTPFATGLYNFTTCGMNTCNTQVWVYSSCPNPPYAEGAAGSFSYNDDDTACGLQANLDVVLMANTPYLIRIGDNMDDCSGPVEWSFSYTGPVTGCTDPAACNYNPLAMVSDGSCVYPPSPLCDGPDLRFDSAAFVTTLGIQNVTASTCDVNEGCVTGYGARQVITFRSKIDNIGTQDYYIGSPSGQPGMFNLQNCHGHAHYEGYGDYRLFDMSGTPIPAGHKNGFCVIDLCGFGQYTCGNMGISVGCYDAYGAGTQCQWLDVTDVPDGDYRMAIIINSRHLPDALGRYETNFANNALQICVNLSRASGSLVFTRLPNCTPYVDCQGLPGGMAESDCNGICNGPGVFGDSYVDANLDTNDVITYMDFIEAGMPASICYDLNGNAQISIYDAALASWCGRQNPLHPAGTAHNYCNFPRNIINPNDSVGLSIKAVDFTNNYVDVEILNPSANVKAYQFKISGATISNVVSLADPILFPVDVRFRTATNEVFAISVEDSSLARLTTAQPLVRVYFSAVTDSVICISQIKDIVNQDAERTITYTYGTCITTGIAAVNPIMKPAEMVLIPNPASERAYLHISNGKAADLTIIDAAGRSYSLAVQPIRDNWFELDLRTIPTGVYFIVLHSSESQGAVRLVKVD
jgi:hypothetical protein